MSLKYRIAATILVLEALMIALVLSATLSRSLERTTRQLEKTDAAVLSMIADVARPALITRQYGSLQSFLDKAGGDPRILTASVLDERGMVVASSDHERLGASDVAAVDSAGHYWRSLPVEGAVAPYGTIAIAFSTTQQLEVQREARSAGIRVALSGMAVIALIGLMSGSCSPVASTPLVTRAARGRW